MKQTLKIWQGNYAKITKNDLNLKRTKKKRRKIHYIITIFEACAPYAIQYINLGYGGQTLKIVIL